MWCAGWGLGRKRCLVYFIILVQSGWLSKVKRNDFFTISGLKQYSVPNVGLGNDKKKDIKAYVLILCIHPKYLLKLGEEKADPFFFFFPKRVIV